MACVSLRLVNKKFLGAYIVGDGGIYLGGRICVRGLRVDHTGARSGRLADR